MPMVPVIASGITVGRHKQNMARNGHWQASKVVPLKWSANMWKPCELDDTQGPTFGKKCSVKVWILNINGNSDS